MRQAVVVIHGIGEQRPMDTLRGFVEAMTQDDPAGEKDGYWSKPDRLSRSFELRVLKSRGRAATDFYEYYWAHKVHGTRYGHLGTWLWDLVKRPRADIPQALAPLWWTARGLLLLFGVGAASGLLAAAHDHLFRGANALTLVPIGISMLLAALQFFGLRYLGDAARYLSPKPENVVLRESIRADGVRLLRALHVRGYDRIVVVGHSLGSVIAYDILGYLWHDYHERLDKIQSDDPALAARFAQNQALQPIIRDVLPEAGKALDGSMVSVLRFREAQAEAFNEQRGLGHPWRITDLVTIGSPIAHASLLLGRSVQDFAKRVARRELPTCPPTRDQKGYSYGAPQPATLGNRKFTPLLLHHAAPFAVTRWTNIYFPARWGLVGDIVAGPVGPVMGLGVLDLPVTVPRWRGWLWRTWISHTRYWSERGGDKGYLQDLTRCTTNPPERADAAATEVVRWALDLTGARRFRKTPGTRSMRSTMPPVPAALDDRPASQ